MKEYVVKYVTLVRRRSVAMAIVLGVVVGFTAIGLIRFAFAGDGETHYHANIAVFINGQREQFKGAQYYQEIAACDQHDSPLGRVHLHDQNNHVVHVHGEVATWSDFFTNLGWSLNNAALFDGKTAYVGGQGGELHFVLNGKPTRSIANEVIGDRDRLLISFGTDGDAALKQQFDQVESDAKKFDEAADPAACQGAAHDSMLERMREAFFF